MRAALLSLVAASGVVACKIDLDEGRPRFCEPSATAPSCLQAESEERSDFAWVEQNIFGTNCSGDDCHGQPENGQEPDGKLVLAEGFAYRTLLGKDPGDTAAAPLVAARLSPKHKLVVPGNPEQSYLLFITKAIAASAGSPTYPEPPEDIGYMPQGNKPICCQKLEALERWIAAGAEP